MLNIIETTPSAPPEGPHSICPICGWRDFNEKKECDRCASATTPGNLKWPTMLWHVLTRQDGTREFLPPESRGPVRKGAVQH
jgi:hypothetical protein